MATIRVLTAGARGPRGAQGVQGPAGTPGGPQGITGPQGFQGSQGPQGNQGPTGPQGSGAQGSQGPQGPGDNKGGISINYSGSVVINAVWSGGDPQKVVSTAASHVTASGYNEWHFSDIPRAVQGQYISATQEDLFSILTGSISDSNRVLVRVWDDVDPLYEAFYINSGSATITNRGNSNGGDLTMQLKWVGGRGFGTTSNQNWPNGTTINNTNVAFEILGGAGDGAQGAQGPKGDNGEFGPQGRQGPAGPEGPQGNVGAQGYQGSTGPQGVQGPQGGRGAQGFQGRDGGVGPQGAQGPASNVAGPQGNQGPVGPVGPSGSASNVAGPQGNQGPAGPSGGPQGPQGAQGPRGNIGRQGPAGTSSGSFDNRGGFTFQYQDSVGLNYQNGPGAGNRWDGGQPQQVITTAANHITQSGFHEWHFSDIEKSGAGQLHNGIDVGDPSGKYAGYDSIWTLLTSSIQDSGDVLVRIWDNENPNQDLYFVNSGSASLGNDPGGGADLVLQLKCVGGLGQFTKHSALPQNNWPSSGTNTGNRGTNVAFQLTGKSFRGGSGSGSVSPNNVFLTGSLVGSGISNFNFTGSGVDVLSSGSDGVLIEITAGAQGPQGPEPRITVFETGSSVNGLTINGLNFTGSGVSVNPSQSNGVLIEIPGSGGGGGSVGTLQQVTDLGNTTTNSITIADLTGSRAILEDNFDNTIIGRDSGYFAYPASRTNVIIGTGSVQSGQVVQNNVIIGSRVAPKLERGANNVLLGPGTMQFSSGSLDSDGNIGIGASVFQYANEINHNIAMGQNSANYLSGSYNIFLGYSTGGGGASHTKTIVIGHNANIYPTSGVYENAIVIGNYDTTYGTEYFDGGSNTVMIGNPGIERNTLWGELDVSGSISASADLVAGPSDDFGLVLTAPNGSQYRVTVDNSGNLSTTLI